MEKESTAAPQSETSEDFVSDYANNVYLEPTIWDIKAIFGEFTAKTNSIEWHTSVTMPWALAKLLAYYLQINVLAHEIRTGKRIDIPDQMKPAAPELSPEQQPDPVEQAILEMIETHRLDLLK